MPINDRNLTAGTELAARYKGEIYSCTVIAAQDGGVAYRLHDFTKDNDAIVRSDGAHIDLGTPSAAGTAVLNGQACNGWRFWSLKDELAAPKEPKVKTPKAAREPRVPKPKVVREPKVRTPRVKKGATAKSSAVFFKTEKQTNVPEGQERWWCNACADAFYLPLNSAEPDACAKGHTVAQFENILSDRYVEEVPTASATPDDTTADEIDALYDDEDDEDAEDGDGETEDEEVDDNDDENGETDQDGNQEPVLTV